jgi:GAF domain-containing protein
VNASLNQNNVRRLTTLRRYEILDSVVERTYDDIVRLASHIFDAPIAAILQMNNGQQLLKSCIGVRGGELFSLHTQSFCHETMNEHEVLMVEDLAVDERFWQNPLVVSGPLVRFFAGAPLATADGKVAGALCVMDTKPRRALSREKDMLRSLSRMVMTTMELRRVSDALAEEVVRVKNLSGLLPICSGCKNIRNDSGYWQRVECYVQENSAAEFTHGMCPDCAHKFFPGVPAEELAAAMK